MSPEREPPPSGAARGRGNRGGRSGASTSPQGTRRHPQPAVIHDPARCAPCGALDVYDPNARHRHEMRAWAKGYRRICDLPEVVVA